MNKRLIIIVVCITIVGLGLAFYLTYRSNTVANEFIGTVNSMGNNSLIIEGVFITPETDTFNFRSGKEVTVSWDENTKITKEVTYIGRPDNIPFNEVSPTKERTQSSLSDLRLEFDGGGLILRARSNTNIYNKKSFVASELIYGEQIIR